MRRIRSEVVVRNFWILQSRCRIISYPDAAYKNNEDKSSQRGQCIFVAEPRRPNAVSPKRSLVDYESQKIKKTVLSTTVSEFYSFMKCFGTCQFLRGLWMDLTGSISLLHMRIDAYNLVTTASATHLPEQKETIHMVNQLRHEALTGNVEDLAHVVSADCLSDCLTKHLAKPDALIKCVFTSSLPNADKNPPFRKLMEPHHKAWLAQWICLNIPEADEVVAFLRIPIRHDIQAALMVYKL